MCPSSLQILCLPQKLECWLFGNSWNQSSVLQRWGCAVDVAEVDSQGVHSLPKRQDRASIIDGKEILLPVRGSHQDSANARAKLGFFTSTIGTMKGQGACNLVLDVLIH